jgi:hypothetical protein
MKIMFTTFAIGNKKIKGFTLISPLKVTCQLITIGATHKKKDKQTLIKNLF